MNVLITGASAGLGAAMTRRFVAEGHTVVATGRRLDRLRALQQELGPSVLPLELDVRDRAAVDTLFAKLPLPIDVLVNNAGLAVGLEPAQTARAEDWDAMVDTNVKGVLHCTRAILPSMVARNRGHLVMMGSIAGEYPYPGGNVYGATKAFLRQLSLNLRADLLGTAVRVTDIEPGMVNGTEFSDIRFRGDAEKAKAVYQDAQPLTPDDIADVVSWVVSRPAHVNVNTLSLMPVCQAFGALPVSRTPSRG